MMIWRNIWRSFLLASILFTLVACASATLLGSWKSPEYSERISKVYIVGVAKQETSRRVFEDGFVQQLGNYNVTGISSYHDIPSVQNADKDRVLQSVKNNGAETVLLTRIVDQRTDQVVNPGRVTGYSNSPTFGRAGYSPRQGHRNYGTYYSRRYELVYEPANVAQYQVVILESNLYDASSGELIWAAQLEGWPRGMLML
ncbi:MAG: hypothetical protein OET90_05825 [Desulfuromonadales bacterium]|nr:hypothetical protein [Desulfuromonadales bacterium]